VKGHVEIREAEAATPAMDELLPLGEEKVAAVVVAVVVVAEIEFAVS
jgi:hypothetical protein